MTRGTDGFGLRLVTVLGYPGLFLGLILEFLGIPFPGETVLTFAGFLVGSGHMLFPLAVLAAMAGSTVGSLAAYLLGRKYGRTVLDRYGTYAFVDSHKIDTAEKWFNSHGILVLLFGRFIPGVRPLGAYLAGIADMRFAVFFPLTVTGALVWCLVFVYIGWHLGNSWSVISKVLKKYDIAAAGLAAAGILVYLIVKMQSRRKS